jgi:3-oxoacyl-[acyl-carrier-protein] synthase-3
VSTTASGNALPIAIEAVGVDIPETFITAAEIAERSGVPEDVIVNTMGIVCETFAGPGDHTNAMGLCGRPRTP